jgi:hypothetical protein
MIRGSSTKQEGPYVENDGLADAALGRRPQAAAAGFFLRRILIV